MTVPVIFDVIESIAIIIAAIAASIGINSWLREARWKRRNELAEDVLYNLYDAKNKLSIIRHPISYASEGQSRPKNSVEKASEEQTRNYGYVTVERFNNNSEPFLNLEKLRLRYIVVFGMEKSEGIDEVLSIKNEILSASYIWAKRTIRYDELVNKQLQESDFSIELDRLNSEIEVFSKVIWENYNEVDAINSRVNNSIHKMEKILLNVIR